jgi:hypothetical protein
MDRSGKDKWIDEVMGSLDGMQRVPAPSGMYDGVMARIRAGRGSKTYSLLPRIAAAAAVLLLAVNVASVFHATSRGRTAAQDKGVYNMVNEQISELESSF